MNSNMRDVLNIALLLIVIVITAVIADPSILPESTNFTNRPSYAQPLIICASLMILLFAVMLVIVDYGRSYIVAGIFVLTIIILVAAIVGPSPLLNLL